jgi:SAM-dependent methyltransferase
VIACRVCGGQTAPVLDLGSSPLADSFPATTEIADSQPRYPLKVAVCSACWLVQLMDVELISDPLLFGEDYAFFSGTSPVLVEHFGKYATWAHREFFDQCRRGVVEIGCNDGTLLRNFQRAGHPCLGIDPAGPPTSRAIERGLDVRAEPFTFELAKQLPVERGGLVIANNVLAHVLDPDDFMRGVVELIGADGVAVFEVQYLADLLAGRQFDLVYHEHRSFFSWSSLRALLARHELVGEPHHVDTQGGSLRVVVRAATAVTAPFLDPVWESEGWLRRPDPYRCMQGYADHLRAELVEMVDAETKHRMVAGYGAAAKASTLLHFAGLTKALDYVVDTTPAKIGRFMPGTQIPVISPAQEQDRRRADTYVCLVANYLPAVLRREREFLADGGHMIVPTPRPIRL